MKIFLEILLSIFLHPIAVLLAWVNIIGRSDLNKGKKIIWILVCIIWGLGPIIYFTFGKGKLW